MLPQSPWYTVHMKYRNAFLCILTLAAALLLYGCNAQNGRLATPAAATPTPIPTPTPAPTPTPVVALWGASDAPAFARAMESAVSQIGYSFVPLSGGEEALSGFASDSRACIIACCTGEAPSVRPAGHIYYCMLGGNALPAGEHGVYYDGSDAVQTVFTEIVDYPPHCAPVRVLGLFAGEDDAAHTAFSAACESGMFFSRGAYFADDKKELSDWLSDKLDDIYPGMLDCIFAETGELAAAAADTLAALSRNDAEIFSASTSGEALHAMENQPELFGCAVGYLPAEAAQTCVDNAVLLITGEDANSGILLPKTFFANGAGAP